MTLTTFLLIVATVLLAGSVTSRVLVQRRNDRIWGEPDIEELEAEYDVIQEPTNWADDLCGTSKSTPGWFCSAERGHEGPCPAWPVSHQTNVPYAPWGHWETKAADRPPRLTEQELEEMLSNAREQGITSGYLQAAKVFNRQGKE